MMMMLNLLMIINA